jgi:hypothetical protein
MLLAMAAFVVFAAAVLAAPAGPLIGTSPAILGLP